MTAYDRIPYPSAPLPRTHPHFLGGLALQYGLQIEPRCRVLDIGCGAGRNLAWIAATVPSAECVGVDLAESAIVEARAFAARIGVSNVGFLQKDFRDIPDCEYDYIIVNGLYSWVDPAMRADLLRFVDQRLAPRGVAMISFHEELRPWRPALLRIADLEVRLQAAKEQVPALADFDDGLLLHDALAEVSDAISIATFIKALPAGMQYLCDARDVEEFHEAVLVHAGRVAAEPLFDEMWFVTEASYPATVQDLDDEAVVIEALAGPRAVVHEAGACPVAWPVARIMVRAEREIMNYFGAMVQLDDEDREILAGLDGTRPRDDVPADTLAFFARAGLLVA